MANTLLFFANVFLTYQNSSLFIEYRIALQVARKLQPVTMHLSQKLMTGEKLTISSKEISSSLWISPELMVCQMFFIVLKYIIIIMNIPCYFKKVHIIISTLYIDIELFFCVGAVASAVPLVSAFLSKYK